MPSRTSATRWLFGAAALFLVAAVPARPSAVSAPNRGTGTAIGATIATPNALPDHRIDDPGPTGTW